LWSVNYVLARTAPGIISPHVLALGRWFLAGLILAFIARHELWRERASTLKAWPQYLVLGFLGMLICGAWVYWGGETTTALNIALIYAAAPVLITLGAVIGLKESFSFKQGLGVLIALVGVLHVVVKGQWAALSQVIWVMGDGLIVIAMMAWAAYALLLKKWQSPLSSTARLAATCMGGSIVLLPFALLEWFATPHAAWSNEATAMVIIAAIFPGVGAYWAYNFCQKNLGASRVATTLYLGPLYGGLVGWLMLNEGIGWHHAVGAALILPGIYLASQASNVKLAVAQDA
jgi:drug/metabolite transporter (DMT)-like permease